MGGDNDDDEVLRSPGDLESRGKGTVIKDERGAEVLRSLRELGYTQKGDSDTRIREKGEGGYGGEDLTARGQVLPLYYFFLSI